jgi:hypothetical protein
MWYTADDGEDLPGAKFHGRMDTIHAYTNWHPMTSCTIDRKWEGVLLQPGDLL